MKIGVWSILISGEGNFRGPQAKEFGGSVEYKEEWSEVGRDPGRGGRGEQDRGGVEADVGDWRKAGNVCNSCSEARGENGLGKGSGAAWQR